MWQFQAITWYQILSLFPVWQNPSVPKKKKKKTRCCCLVIPVLQTTKQRKRDEILGRKAPSMTSCFFFFLIYTRLPSPPPPPPSLIHGDIVLSTFWRQMQPVPQLQFHLHIVKKGRPQAGDDMKEPQPYCLFIYLKKQQQRDSRRTKVIYDKMKNTISHSARAEKTKRRGRDSRGKKKKKNVRERCSHNTKVFKNTYIQRAFQNLKGQVCKISQHLNMRRDLAT